MSKKNKWLRRVSRKKVLEELRRKRKAVGRDCHEMAMGGISEWSRTHPWDILLDWVKDMTDEEWQAYLAQRYPDNPPNAVRVPKEHLYRGQKK